VKRRCDQFCLRVLEVDDTAVRISAVQGDKSAKVSVLISGKLDAKIRAATRAELSVWEVADSAPLGAAVGISSGLLRLQVGLMRQEFVALLAIVTAGRLSHVQLLLDPIVRGKGKFRSITYSTKPIS